MPLLKHIRLPKLSFVLWKIDETEEELMAMLPPFFRQHYGNRLQKFSHQERRMEWLATRVSVHHSLGIEVPIDYRENGSPYLKECSLHISVSHSRGKVAVIVSEFPVGVDIEFFTEKAHRLQSRFLTSQEQTILSESLSTNQRATACVQAWAAKEAAFKYYSQITPIKLLADTRLTKVNEDIFSLQSLNKETCHVAHFLHGNYVIAVALGEDIHLTCRDIIDAFQSQ